MMNPLKNILTFAAQLPEARALEGHLAELPFVELTDSQFNGAGFVPHPITQRLVSEFEGGLALTVRYDEKIIPAAAVRNEVEKRAKVIEEQEGRPLHRKAKQDLKDQVIAEYARKNMINRKLVMAYYLPASKRLFVDSASEKMGQLVMNCLIKVVGSVKMETTYVTNVKHGLTTRLKALLSDESPEHSFSYFEVGDKCRLSRKLETTETINYTGLDVSACDELWEHLDTGFEVDALGLILEGTEFTLTQDFHLKGMKWGEVDESDAEDQHEAWAEDASAKLLILNDIWEQLLKLVEYKEAAQEKVA